MTRSPGGLCLVDAHGHRSSRIIHDPVPLESVELTADGLRLASAGPLVRYDTLTFAVCERR